jgi:hypothetical protein
MSVYAASSRPISPDTVHLLFASMSHFFFIREHSMTCLGQGDGAVWRLTVRLASKAGAGEVVLERLWGATRLEEVLRQGAAALGVRWQAEAAVRFEGRVPRGEETLAEAGVGAGDVVEVWVREAGGMPGVGARALSILAGGAAEEAAGGSDYELAGAVEQLAQDASGIEEAVMRLASVRLANEGAGTDSVGAVGSLEQVC